MVWLTSSVASENTHSVMDGTLRVPLLLQRGEKDNMKIAETVERIQGEYVQDLSVGQPIHC
jgi:hypothetical protein